ncbi:MAG: YozE family protein [Anaeroplasma sp.]
MATLSFKSWLIQYAGNDPETLDIKYDVTHDNNFPNSDSYDEIHSYLKWDKHADRIVLEFFEYAFNCYSLEIFGKQQTSHK